VDCSLALLAAEKVLSYLQFFFSDRLRNLGDGERPMLGTIANLVER
jgi:hypothetical protein